MPEEAQAELIINSGLSDPAYNGAMANRKLPSGLYTIPAQTISSATMAVLATINNVDFEKLAVQIQNIDDADSCDVNLYGSMDPNGGVAPAFDTATWTKILTNDVAIDYGVTKTLENTTPYYWVVVTGQKTSGDGNSTVLVFARGINNGHNS